MAIARFALAICADCARNGISVQLNNTQTQNLVHQAQSLGADVFQFTDCALTRAIPVRTGSARQIACALLGAAAALTGAEAQRRLLQAAQRACAADMGYINNVMAEFQGIAMENARKQANVHDGGFASKANNNVFGNNYTHNQASMNSNYDASSADANQLGNAHNFNNTSNSGGGIGAYSNFNVYGNAINANNNITGNVNANAQQYYAI